MALDTRVLLLCRTPPFNKKCKPFNIVMTVGYVLLPNSTCTCKCMEKAETQKKWLKLH